MNRYGPVDARVYLHSPSSWYQSLQINKGTNDGVKEGDPVINGAGLVGKIETRLGRRRGRDADHRPRVRHRRHHQRLAGARQRRARRRRARRPAVQVRRQRDQGAARASSSTPPGTISSRLESRYPPAIPIGKVDRIDIGDGELDRRIHIKPAADLKRVDMVQVLTEPHADLDAK